MLLGTSNETANYVQGPGNDFYEGGPNNKKKNEILPILKIFTQ